jgi:hypothetical protein
MCFGYLDLFGHQKNPFKRYLFLKSKEYKIGRLILNNSPY